MQRDHPLAPAVYRNPGARTWIALLLIIHFVYGAAPDLSPAHRLDIYLIGSILFAALLALCLSVLMLPVRPEVSGLSIEPLSRQALLLIVVVAFAAYTAFPDRFAVILIVVLLSVQIPLLWRSMYLVSLAATGVAIIGGLALVILQTRLADLGADMLPVCIWANRILLQHANPYFADHHAVTPWPFFYLPLQWLIYMPLVLLHVDVRWLNFAAIIGTLLLLFWNRHNLTNPWLAFTLMLLFIVSRPSTEMLYQGEVWPFWFIVSAFSVLLLRGHPVRAAVALGCLLGISQTAIHIAGLTAVWRLRSAGKWYRTMLMGALAAGVYFISTIPFAHGIVAFIRNEYVVLPHLAGRLVQRVRDNRDTEVSLVNLLLHLGLIRWRMAIQLTVVLGTAAVLAVRRTGTRTFLYLTGVSYLAAISLNMQVWKYYYGPGLLLMFWSIVWTPSLPNPAPQ
ncbi:MAG: hypothetical protein ACP5NP_03870 [Acetobacteraceae bacterium]